MRIMITGGGTGGHTSPAAAVIEELRRRDPRLLLQWVGNKHGMEAQVARRYSVPLRHLPVEGWSRRRSPRMLWTVLKLLWSVIRAWFYLKVFQPQVIFGVGGYASLPAVWAAQRMGVSTVLHEQNKRLGLANRICAARATRLLLSYPDTNGAYPRERAMVTGNPVRAAFLNPPDQASARERLGLDPDTPTVLITGGSQGAHTLNAAMADVMNAFNADTLQFIWGAGKTDVMTARRQAEETPPHVQVHAFIEDMAEACAAADIVVSRAGASTTAELAALGKPSILVPYPHAADNHQEHNARAFEQAGAAIVLLNRDCTGERLATLLRELLASPERLARMGNAAKILAHPTAAEAIAEVILETAHGDADIRTDRSGP